MGDEQPERVGHRIAELRKIHGTTQHALAMRAAVSYSLLRKVERGERPASPSFIATVARALSVHVADITEQPFGVRNAGPGSEQAGVPALRQALVEGDDPELATDRRDLTELRAAVAQIKDDDRRTRHAEVVRALPDVLRHLHRTVMAAPNDQQPLAREVLAAAYGYAVVALYRLGHLDLAHLADERARAVATASADPLRAAAAEWNHSLMLMFDGAYQAGLRGIYRADALVTGAGPGPAATAVRGALHLRAAIIAARACDADLAETHLDEAARLIEPGQEQANHYGTKFSEPNVAIPRRDPSRAGRRHEGDHEGSHDSPAGGHRAIAGRALLDRLGPGLAAARRPKYGAGTSVYRPSARPSANPLPPPSPRVGARSGRRRCA